MIFFYAQNGGAAGCVRAKHCAVIFFSEYRTAFNSKFNYLTVLWWGYVLLKQSAKSSVGLKINLPHSIDRRLHVHKKGVVNPTRRTRGLYRGWEVSSSLSVRHSMQDEAEMLPGPHNWGFIIMKTLFIWSLNWELRVEHWFYGTLSEDYTSRYEIHYTQMNNTTLRSIPCPRGPLLVRLMGLRHLSHTIWFFLWIQ